MFATLGGIMTSTRVTMRFDFADGRRLGPGKIALLEALAATGSIAAAGRAHGMAYRRAWLLVDEMNHMFKQPVVIAKGGGKAGGRCGAHRFWRAPGRALSERRGQGRRRRAGHRHAAGGRVGDVASARHDVKQSFRQQHIEIMAQGEGRCA